MLKCQGTTPLPAELPNRKVEWSAAKQTLMQKLSKARRVALEADAAAIKQLDSQQAKQFAEIADEQEYWERLVLEAGTLTHLSPTKTANYTSWLANWLGVKVGMGSSIRENLLNVRRLSEGNLREAGIYRMMTAQQDFSTKLKGIAKERGITVDVTDAQRFIEEGLTPQRMAVYGNSPTQVYHLNARYAKFEADMLARGFTKPDLVNLLDDASAMVTHLDTLRAIQRSTGMEVGEMFNIGYMPRVMTNDGYQVLNRVKAISSMDEAEQLLAKSRNTWHYLPEDHALASKMLGVDTEQLHFLIANPQDMAKFLSTRLSDAQLNLMIDSGILSKIPMTTTEVATLIAEKYKVPLVSSDMFIADPLKASIAMTNKLKAGVEQSALVKYMASEGMKAGWAVTKEAVEGSPKQFANYVPLDKIPGVVVEGKGLFVHPTVAGHLKGVISIAQSPAQMSNLHVAYKWFTQTFAKQALGNPITTPVYLGRQFMSNAFATAGRGVGLHHYLASISDVMQLSTKGLGSFDNVKPFRYLDGKPVTHQEFVAKTMRMFSKDLLPGVNVGADTGGLIDWTKLDPRYIRAHLERIRADGNLGVAGYTGEVVKTIGGAVDELFNPTLRMANILDMAGQLAITRGKAGVDSASSAVWVDVVSEVKSALPMFDDAGKIPGVIQNFMPFTSWSIQNAPLQLRDMTKRPSTWYNYARVQAVWNSERLGEGDVVPQGGMKDWERDKYGIVLNRDTKSGELTMLFHGDYDPHWGALTWLANLVPDAKSEEEKRNEIRGRDTEKALNSILSKTYFSGIYKTLSGIDPLTGLRRDESPLTFQQFGNIPMPGWMASVLSISPLMQSIDRLPAISGTKAVLDPRTGTVVQQAVDGWLGNAGTATPNQLEGVERFAQTVGGSLRVINTLRNMQYTERDITSTMTSLIAKQAQEQRRLAEDKQRGSVDPDSDSFKRRSEAINRMTDTILQLNVDLARVERWAVANKVPSLKALEEMSKRKVVLEQLPMPGAEYLRSQLDESLGRRPK
jgi:hypothetical protein